MICSIKLPTLYHVYAYCYHFSELVFCFTFESALFKSVQLSDGGRNEKEFSLA